MNNSTHLLGQSLLGNLLGGMPVLEEPNLSHISIKRACRGRNKKRSFIRSHHYNHPHVGEKQVRKLQAKLDIHEQDVAIGRSSPRYPDAIQKAHNLGLSFTSK